MEVGSGEYHCYNEIDCQLSKRHQYFFATRSGGSIYQNLVSIETEACDRRRNAHIIYTSQTSIHGYDT